MKECHIKADGAGWVIEGIMRGIRSAPTRGLNTPAANRKDRARPLSRVHGTGPRVNGARCLRYVPNKHSTRIGCYPAPNFNLECIIARAS